MAVSGAPAGVDGPLRPPRAYDARLSPGHGGRGRLGRHAREGVGTARAKG